MNAILQATVADAMSEVRYTVSALQKINQVAGSFSQQHINSAPVVDDTGRCIGIITSSDLVRYQALVEGMDSRIDHGMNFEVTRSQEDGTIELVPHPFDEVQRHMSTAVQTISADCQLVEAAKIMTQQHIHHLVVLDKSGRAVGILSSLDLLAKLSEVPQ
jgi:predicted transcriptional regulator